MNGSNDHIHTTRVRRLTDSWDDVHVQVSPALETSGWCSRRWVALTCSRLGSSTQLQAEICRFLSRSLLDCRARGDVVLVAEHSAVASWGIRAAELFGVDLVRLTVGELFSDRLPRIVVESKAATFSHDAATIVMADRVDAVYVRTAGRIDRSLRQRVSSNVDVSTRVAVTTTKKSAARELMAAGAIGWFVQSERKSKSTPLPSRSSKASVRQSEVDPPWMRSDGQWLVHCTRTCHGPWPFQTRHQFQDALLLGEGPLNRTPLDTLRQILRRGILVANAIASAKAWPVVCFSESPLRELLDRRCFRPHLKRWDYEPYGIAIRKSTLQRLGGQKVIYADPADRDQFTSADQFRIQAVGKTFDWRSEREWRISCDIDLNQLQIDEVKVFVSTDVEAAILAQQTLFHVDVASLKAKSPESPVAQSDSAV